MNARALAAVPALAIAGSLGGCGGCDDAPPPPPPPPPADGGLCDEFVVPGRPDTSSCDDEAVDPAEPERLVACLRGSGHAGAWAIDADGLPAYDFALDERCDPAASSWTPRPAPLRDPIFLLGNGRGVVAMAHASGGIELYTQDRGHKWLDRIEAGLDPGEFPPQIGGGFGYVVVGERVLSTRFEDLPAGPASDPGSALALQPVRRFGVGYAETVTDLGGGLTVRRRTFAPDAEARALVSEVTVENASGAPVALGLVELWDVDVHQIAIELLTSDLLSPSLTTVIDEAPSAASDLFNWDNNAVALGVSTAFHINYVCVGK